MNLVNAKKLFLILGITVFLSGALMTISHIKYGGHIVLVGIVLISLRLIPPLFRNIFIDLDEDQISDYPNISQSFGITGIVISGMLLLIPLNLVLNKVIGKEASMLIYYLFAIGIPLGIIYSIRKSKTNIGTFSVALENKRIIPYLIICSIALLFGIVSPIGNLIPMPESIKKAVLELGSQTGIYAFILMVIAAPVMEELIFRGIILDGLLKKYAPVKSILVSSLLFGTVHLNPWQFVTAFFIGIFSGWVYYKTRSVLPSIIIHASINLSGFYMRFILDLDSAMDKSLAEMYGGLTKMILIISGSILIASICIYFLIKEFNKTDLIVSKFELP